MVELLSFQSLNGREEGGFRNMVYTVVQREPPASAETFGMETLNNAKFCPGKCWGINISTSLSSCSFNQLPVLLIDQTLAEKPEVKGSYWPSP